MEQIEKILHEVDKDLLIDYVVENYFYDVKEAIRREESIGL